MSEQNGQPKEPEIEEGENAFRRFEELAKRLVTVPKSEIDKARKREKTAKRSALRSITWLRL